MALCLTAMGTVLAGPVNSVSAPPASQPATPIDIRGLLEPIRSQFKLPALAGAVVQGNRLLAIGAVGQRSINAPERVTINDQWHLGSCTKSMTATLLGMLVEEGKLSWNTTIGETFPELKDEIRSEYAKVTLVQLLRHRSGLREDRTPDELFFRMKNELSGPIIAQRLKAIQWVLARPPSAPPDTKMQYSNSGYIVAGAMAEKVTGKSWEELMQKRLFGPLGMTSAGFGPPGTKGKNDQPRGHLRELVKTRSVDLGPDADNPPVFGPCGTVHASLADWGKYASLHLEGIRGRSRLVKPETLAALYCPSAGEGSTSATAHPWTPDEIMRLAQGLVPSSKSAEMPEGYAGGWVVTSRPWGGMVLMHTGSNGIWYATLWLSPRKDFAVLAATNIGDAKAPQACDAAASALIEYHLSGKTSVPSGAKNK